jgi:hypothetical protein
MTLKLTEKFMKGLQEYNLTLDEMNNWKYCGGNKDEHYRYFKLCCKDDDFPEPTDHCVCGHHIEENCYITDGNEILVLGNCCIKKFIKNKTRTCSTCGEPHKNRKVNKCNHCRIGLCDICERHIDESYKTCWGCK